MEPNPDREQEIFSEAAERTGRDRDAYLNQACADDPALRARVESLLEAIDQVQGVGFLDKPTGGTGESPSASSPQSDEPLGSSIGPYTLRQTIGEGGFGTVYLAEQSKPIERRVALKIIKLGMDTREVMARFDAERQALAMMDHPGIARVYDAGATDRGRPYFVMELVQGAPITQYCDREQATVHQRLVLFQRVCEAVQHAHQKGVIHRDLKPSNVLVSGSESRPDPKVIDFGVAKATGGQSATHTAYTAANQVIGTPAYMSPEQAGQADAGVDTRSDVYSLGVLLYELLTGQTPLDASSPSATAHDEVLRAIREVTPPKPSTCLTALGTLGSVANARSIDPKRLPNELKGDLDWIVMRALEKDPDRRYSSPEAFAADIERFLVGEPVEACPPSMAYTARKYASRNRVPLAFASALLLAMAGGLVGIYVFAVRAVQSERVAVAQTESANRELARANEIKVLLSDMLTSVSPDVARGQDTTMLRSILDATGERIRDGEISDPIVRDDIAATIAKVYRGIGAPDVAEVFSRDVYESVSARLDSNSPETIEARSELAITLEEVGDWDGARALYQENVDLFEIGNATATRAGVEARMELLNLLAQGPPNPEVVEDFEKLTEDAEQSLGEDDALTLDVSHALARQYLLMKRNEESYQIMTRVVNSMRESTHPDDPALILAVNTLGSNCVTMRRFDEAEPLLLEALEKGRRVLGESHPRLPSVMDALSYLYMLTNRMDDAVTIGQDSIRIRSAALGPDHPAVIGSSANLGGIMTNAGQAERAALLLQDALERARRVFGPSHPITLRAINNLGSALLRLERLDEARPLLAEALENRRTSFGPSHASTLPTTINLAVVEHRLGNNDRAAELLEIAYDARVQAFGAGQFQTREVCVHYVPVLLDQANYAKAHQVITSELMGIRQAWGAPAQGEPAKSPAELSNALLLLGRAEWGLGNQRTATEVLVEAFELAYPADETEPDEPSTLARTIAGYLATWFLDRETKEPGHGHAESAARFKTIAD